MTKHHFASDNFNGGSSSSYSRNQGYSHTSSSNRGPRAPPANHNRNDEDEEIRKAIEISKETAKKEEEMRKKRTKPQQVNSGEKDDFDIGAGFEKFATGAQGNNNDIDDFDFGNLGGSNSKKEENKHEEEFNFDVGATQ